MSFILKIKTNNRSDNETSPDIYQLASRGTNVILIAEQELTLIDTGHDGDSSQIINFIHELGRSVEEISLIILTHNHVDHVGGLAEIRRHTSAKIAIHKSDIGEREGKPSVREDEADIYLEGGEVLEPIGGLEVIHTPGHTPGCISLFSPRNRLLLIGDAVRKRRKHLHMPLELPNSNMTQAMGSITKISSLDFDCLVFGHGLPMVNEARTRIRELIERIKD